MKNIFETILHTVAHASNSIRNFDNDKEIIVHVNEKTLHLLIEMMIEYLKRHRNPSSIKYSILDKEPFIHEPYRPKVIFAIDVFLNDYEYVYNV